MPKQYHFWPGKHGLDAWDVDRLIGLSAEFQPREVLLETIQDLDTDYLFDGSMEVATVRKSFSTSDLSSRLTPRTRSFLAPTGASWMGCTGLPVPCSKVAEQSQLFNSSSTRSRTTETANQLTLRTTKKPTTDHAGRAGMAASSTTRTRCC